MKAIDSVERPQRREIVIEQHFPQSPQQVWRLLSEPELLAQWLLPNDIDAQFVESSAGRRFNLGKKFYFSKDSNTDEKPNFDKRQGDIECEVLACEPGRLLSYSWRTGQEGGDLDSVVTFVLTATEDGGTHLRLVHSGLPQATAQIVAMRQRKTPIVKCQHRRPSCEAKLSWAA